MPREQRCDQRQQGVQVGRQVYVHVGNDFRPALGPDLLERAAPAGLGSTGATLMDATFEMSRKRYGSTAVVNERGELVGAFTDGDLRRSFATNHLHDDISAHMTPNPLAVPPTTLSSDALRIMNENAVTVLFVCEDSQLVGAIHLHDVLRHGVA